MKNINEIAGFLENLIQQNPAKIVGIGECGFDFYHDNVEQFFSIQKEVFKLQIDLAEKHNLPVVIHTRDANKELIDFFAEFVADRNIRGVIHCFSGDLEMAKLFTEEYGFYLGIGGIITYNKSEELRSVVSEIPAKFLLTETDAPFLPPHNWRKKNSLNEPASLQEIVAKIADVKDLEIEEQLQVIDDYLQEKLDEAIREDNWSQTPNSWSMVKGGYYE